ncbi:MAG: ion transporter [Gemmatimonadales bacterium]|nr:MAG: ion transporter [Gemmatimonadales bacterium]
MGIVPVATRPTAFRDGGSLKSRLKRLVEDTDTRGGRAFDLVVQLLIVISLAGFALETLPDLGPTAIRVLGVMEVVIVGLFTIEYMLRVLVADRKRDFVLSFFGVVDLLAILPFYLATGVDLRSIRVVRLLRLVRILKFVRYGKALARLRRAFRLAREELILFLVASLMVVYVASVGIYYFENEAQPELYASVFHSMWWALVTLTTVGYGDVYPITLGGRLFTAVILFIGLGVVAVPAGIMASALSQAREEADRAERE